MKIPDYETRLDALFDAAFRANHPAMLDWVAIKFELKSLRSKWCAIHGGLDCDCPDHIRNDINRSRR